MAIYAFPTAYGAAATITGGRGKPVYHVTNLNDSGAGSFKQALIDAKTTNGGIIVFDVSGVIEVDNRIGYDFSDNLTIAGQTAPEGGITIANDPNSTNNLLYNSGKNNIIIRYIKFKNGTSYLNGNASDGKCLEFQTSDNILIDHCSFFYGHDKNLTVKTGDVTIQNCIFSRGLDAVILGSDDNSGATCYRNAFLDPNYRVPNIGGSDGRNTKADIVNNVVHNWRLRSSRFDYGDYKVNFIGNYYQSGYHTDETNPEIMYCTHTTTTMSPQIWDEDNYWSPEIITEANNRASGGDTYPSQPWVAWDPFADSTEPIKEEWFVGSRLSIYGREMPILASTAVKSDVLANVGAKWTLDGSGNKVDQRDSLEQYFIDRATNNDQTNVDTYYGSDSIATNEGVLYPAFAPYDYQPTFASRPVSYYNNSKSPDIPEAWYDTYMSPGDSATDLAPSGYTWIEEFINQVDNEVYAFPTAYGGGASATGGRGYSDVYHVTNLNDSGPGSFRDAVSQGNRTVVFDVSGIIESQSNLSIGVDNITIAGQTAPIGGITLKGSTVTASGQNIILRYIRFRCGLLTSSDAFGGYYMSNSIVDHCSFSFSRDEAASFITDIDGVPFENFTFQNNFVANTKTGSIMGSGSSDTLNEFDDINNISVLNNLYYNITHRFPNIGGDGRFDVINNVAWHMYKRGVRGNGDFQLNQIGNYYEYGDAVEDEELHHFSYATGDTPEIYTSGNVISSRFGEHGSNPISNTIAEMNADNFLSWKWFLTETGTPYGDFDRGDQLPNDFKALSQFTLVGRAITPVTASQALTNVQSNAGANASLNADGSVSNNRDTLETNWVNQISANNLESYVLEADYPTATPAITSLSRSGGYYVTNAHIPETWGQANIPGFDANSHNDLAPSGYTWLEEFLNQVDTSTQIGDIPVITLIGNSVINLNNGDTYNEQGATASDTEDGDISGSIVIGGDTVDTNTDGTYIITYNVTDSNGNAAIQKTRTVVVSTPTVNIPVITLIGDAVINLNVGDTYVELEATATDVEDGDISENIIITGIVDTNTVGTYIREYNVTDSDFNEAITVTRTINVSQGNLRYNLDGEQKLNNRIVLKKLRKYNI